MNKNFYLYWDCDFGRWRTSQKSGIISKSPTVLHCYVIGVSIAATAEEGSGVILRTSPRKGVHVQGKEVPNLEGTTTIKYVIICDKYIV